MPLAIRWGAGIKKPGRVLEDFISTTDLAPTFLELAGVPVPHTMAGKSQAVVWQGGSEPQRDHVLVENRHEPSTIHLHTYIEERYKLTTYRRQEYGELFDLATDPEEVCNLWDSPAHQELKARLLLKLVHAEMEKEPPGMPRVWGA